LRKVVASAVEKKEEQMVLIFGGKILKDTDTVESHSIKDGQAVHLVVKQPRQEDPKPAAETSSAPVPGPASTTTTTTPSSTTRASPTAASTNPFAGRFRLIIHNKVLLSTCWRYGWKRWNGEYATTGTANDAKSTSYAGNDELSYDAGMQTQR